MNFPGAVSPLVPAVECGGQSQPWQHTHVFSPSRDQSCKGQGPCGALSLKHQQRPGEGSGRRCEDSARRPPPPAPGARPPPRPLGGGARSRPPAVPTRRPGGEAGPCQTPRVLPSQDTQPSRPRVRLLCDRFLDSPWWFWGAWQVFCRTPLRWGLCDVPPGHTGAGERGHEVGTALSHHLEGAPRPQGASQRRWP